MAVSIRLDNLSKDDIRQINNDLRFVPEKKGPRGKKMKGETIYFMEEFEDYIDVPFKYGVKNYKFEPSKGLKTKIRFRKYYFNEMRPEQREVMVESLKSIKKHGSLIQDLGTGFGKTRLGLYLASELDSVTGILIKNVSLMEQWEHTSVHCCHCIPYIFHSKQKKKYNGEKVIIIMAGCVKRMPKEVLDIIRFLIVDEADCFCCESGKSILPFHPRWLLLQTATVKREDGMHEIMYTLTGKNSIWRPRTRAFHLVMYNTNIDVKREYNFDGNVKWSEVITQLSMNKKRNKMIIDYAVQGYSDEGYTAILTREINHSIYLCKKAQKYYESDYMAGTKKTFKKCKFLTGTFSKLGRGVDVATLIPTDEDSPKKVPKHINRLLVAHSIKGDTSRAQIFGRARAEGAIITMFLDNDTAIQKHGKLTTAWAKDNGCTGIDYIYQEESETSSESEE